MTTSTANFPELLWPGIKKIFGDTYDSWESKYDKISVNTPSDKAFEKFQGITEFQPAVEKGQGSSLEYDDMKQGFQKEAVNVTYGLGSTVTMEMWQDEQYGKIRKLPAALAKSFRYTQEIIVADQYNSGFSTATAVQTAADGLSVFNGAHLLVGGGTYRNTPAIAADLTMSSLEQAYIDISDYVNDRGLPIMARAKKLVVPTALQFTAQKLLDTQYAVGSADNDVNVVSRANVPVELIVNPYLTDPNAWFIITSEDENGIQYVDRMKAEADRDNVFDTKSLKFSVVGRFTVVTADARGVYGSPGAS